MIFNSSAILRAFRFSTIPNCHRRSRLHVVVVRGSGLLGIGSSRNDSNLPCLRGVWREITAPSGTWPECQTGPNGRPDPISCTTQGCSRAHTFTPTHTITQPCWWGGERPVSKSGEALLATGGTLLEDPLGLHYYYF